jgi:hypothetical protein
MTVERIRHEICQRCGVLQFPAPSTRRCYKLGQALRRAIESYPEDLKVAIVAIGGLSWRAGSFVALVMVWSGRLRGDPMRASYPISDVNAPASYFRNRPPTLSRRREPLRTGCGCSKLNPIATSYLPFVKQKF